MKKSKPQKNSKTNNKTPTTLSEFFKKIEEKKKGTDEETQKTVNEQDENQCDTKVNVTNSPKKRKQTETLVDSDATKRICLSQIPSISTNSSAPVSYANKQGNHSKTPEKVKNSHKTSRTPPPKLFQRTPTKVSDFSVNIIKNFVKITPSKSAGKSSPSSSGKIRTTPLKHCSPSVSNRSIEAQKLNEKTPIKETPTKKSTISPTSRVKAKLDFGESKSPPFIRKINEEGCSKSTGISVESEIKDILSENSINECFSNFFDNEFEEELLAVDDGIYSHEYTLDLSESKYCKVIKLELFPSYNKITIKSNTTEEYGLCLLKDFWFSTNLEVGDKIHIMAKKLDLNWVVDNHNGLIVYEPDSLISSTSVVNTLFCKRRSVLSEKFYGFEAANEYMVVGTLVHSILQQSLKFKYNSIPQIEENLELILKSKESVRRIYESGQTLESVRSKMAIYIPKILEFTETYVQARKKNINKNCWQGRIDQIEDIEENIWCRELGIKGKVDVTVRHGSKIMPLELKTGKSSFSLEHKGQVLLYIMMMNKLGHKVDSGLLLYLKDGTMKEIRMSDNEKRDIIILRNELAYYLKRKPKLIRSDLREKIKKIEPSELPAPINHQSACGKCPYNIICTTFLEYSKEDLSNNKHLRNVKDEVLAHLTEEHINYFILWNSLINLEEMLKKSASKSTQEILSVPPSERESKGRCICNLKISETSEEFNGLMDHTFVKNEESNFNFFSSAIEEGNYCIISTDTRPAVLTGFVSFVDTHFITVALEKNLKTKYPNEKFHIDTYESSVNHGYNRTSLSMLLEPSEKAKHLRSMIIDKKSPTFSNKLPKVVAVKGIQILKRLNPIQRKAVLKAISANDYLLIKGMPGTGKSATIVALVELLSVLGKTVLITSHTHSAVDNICVKLCKLGVDFMRLGSQAKINSSLEKYSEHFKTKDCTTPEQLAEVYEKTKIIAVTCLGSGHPILSKKTLDVCIVDESTQVLQPTILRPLFVAKVFILVGDPEQLPPVVRSPEAIDLGMDESMFKRLDGKDNGISLTMNYRMNQTITKLANDLTYKGNLLVANEKTARSTISLREEQMLQIFETSAWMKQVLDTRLEHSVKFIDTGPVWKRDDIISWNLKDESLKENKSLMNIHEAAIIYHLTCALLKGGIEPENIGVITTFNLQVKQLSCILNQNIDISSVDKFQGKDKDVIIYSCTKSVDQSIEITESRVGIMEDHRRLNVAVTRAKKKLILVGDLSTVNRYSPFIKLLACLEESHIIKLKENEDNFDWTQVLNSVK